MDPALAEQIQPYQPWLIITGVVVLFYLLRLTRRALRRRVDECGLRLFGDRGLMIWFWLNAPGVMLHELSHALVVLLLYPFGFRITSVTLFRIKPVIARAPNGGMLKRSARPSLQLGEVQYVRPPARVMSHIGDGLSAVAPLFGGIVALLFLYWVATGYNLWEIHLQIFRPGWPWWTLIFTPYLILTVTSELWPSHQDWHGARWFMICASLLTIVIVGLLWYLQVLIFDTHLLQSTAVVMAHVDFALLILLALDAVFLTIAELLVRLVR